MTTLPARSSSRSVGLTLCLALVATFLVAHTATPADASTSTAVMRHNEVTPQQMAAWFRDRSPGGYAAQTSINNLTHHYIAEGRAEGVAGDIAFVQSVLETSWFRFPSHGQVRATHNNFSGLGACDGGACTVAQFRTPRIGVRAQIQHLRAYADPTVTVSNLTYALESPRFHLVTPKGRTPTWEQMGGGNWATDVAYSTKVLTLYDDLLSYARANGGIGTIPEYGDVRTRSSHAADIVAIRNAGWTNGCDGGRVFCPTRSVTRAEMASFLVRAANIAPTNVSRYRDVPRSHTHHDAINALASAGFTNGCGNQSFCPDRAVTRAEMASFLQRTTDLPRAGQTRYSDVSYNGTHGREISAIADANLTNGCGNGRFCPDRRVSRQEMASFLRRAFLR